MHLHPVCHVVSTAHDRRMCSRSICDMLLLVPPREVNCCSSSQRVPRKPGLGSMVKLVTDLGCAAAGRCPEMPKLWQRLLSWPTPSHPPQCCHLPEPLQLRAGTEQPLPHAWSWVRDGVLQDNST